ncbi:hypothetical protein PENSTE_c006G07469 [Penicillium steckii]|uniref:60S ribosomal protein L27 n=2 Tax=Penicillium TaxID=5073 RepID=A0A1V6TGS1_9EURO|nr:hypothetical protein PENSTE_c006G07469 [Penicillium steckii]
MPNVTLRHATVGKSTNQFSAHKSNPKNSPSPTDCPKSNTFPHSTTPANLAANRDLHNEVCVFTVSATSLRFHTDKNVATVMKVGRVAIITRGRYAGKKVVIVQPQDTGSKAHPFPYAIVAGIERYPLKVTRRMGKKLVDRRSRIKPFIKVVNYNHLMPTRYTLELEGLKGVVSQDTFKEVSQREDAKKTIKKALEDRYTSGKNRWFFTPLRF